jgi:hypothetical protein
MRWPHIHWHRRVGAWGLFLQPVYRCRCGSEQYRMWY